MYLRTATDSIVEYARLYPCIGITGPRQSGKTTLARTLFPDHPYLSFENPNVLRRAQEDCQSFLEQYREGAIFDEIQHFPELLSYLQGIVDADQVMGRYIITGSQNFALSEHITQSLAGRIAMVTLLPLSITELGGTPTANELMLAGGYPGMHVRGMEVFQFFPQYIQTYVERDVRQIKNIENMALFQRFMRLCAGRIGQVANCSALAQDCGISSVTAQQWLSVLQASYVVFLVSPYHANFSKRLIKMPKLYFYDTGLACSLLDIEAVGQLDTHPVRGHMFENLVVLELLKSRLNRGRLPQLYFWRDQTGHEVDVVADWGGVMRAIEIKSSSTFHPEYLKGIKYLRELSTTQLLASVIYAGTERYQVSGIDVVPLNQIDAVFK